MKNVKHKFSYPRYGSCLFFLVSLYLKGRIKEVYYKFPHFMAITKKDNVIHLTYKGYEDYNYAPVCFYGRPEIFKINLLKRFKYVRIL